MKKDSSPHDHVPDASPLSKDLRRVRSRRRSKITRYRAAVGKNRAPNLKLSHTSKRRQLEWLLAILFITLIFRDLVLSEGHARLRYANFVWILRHELAYLPDGNGTPCAKYNRCEY